jgi:hypothetical protein
MKNLQVYSQQIKSAKNMVEVENIISRMVFSFFEDYSQKNPAPPAGAQQQDWIKKVRNMFNPQILEAKQELIKSIPERFFVTKMYADICKSL